MIWEISTGKVTVDSLEHWTRGDAMKVLLFMRSAGSSFHPANGDIVRLVAKTAANSSLLFLVDDWQKPASTLDPMVGTLNLTDTASLIAAFEDADGERESVNVKIELEWSSGPTSSQRVDVKIWNQYARPADGWVPPGVPMGFPNGRMDLQVFDASGTWKKPLGAKFALVKLWGGAHGADSGRKLVPGESSSTFAGGMSGSPGKITEAWIDVSLLPDAVDVVVGAGGLGGVFNHDTASQGLGQAGGASSFGALLTAAAGAANTAVDANGWVTFIPSAVRGIPGRSSSNGFEQGSGNMQIYRLPTGGGAGGSAVRTVTSEVSYGTYNVGFRGGNIGTGTAVAVAGGLGGVNTGTESEMDGESGKVDPVSGNALGAGGGSAGEMQGGRGGDGVAPGGAPGGGGSSAYEPGAGGNGGNGRVIVQTFCAL